ncbi:MAG: aspartyl-phosphate phosphatase Spo0E family protein [Lachnospiraceae bacterium]|nr:aspartyl-phosphate phosphatase Spo0E family protein [Lachnospiraceae bacterium]
MEKEKIRCPMEMSETKNKEIADEEGTWNKSRLQRRIEEEREKLNLLVEKRGMTEEAYLQSQVLDELIVRYMEEDVGIVPTVEPQPDVGIASTVESKPDVGIAPTVES